MNPNDCPEAHDLAIEVPAGNGESLLSPLLLMDSTHAASSEVEPRQLGGVILGELLAIVDDGATPMVRYLGQIGTSGLCARTCVDLNETHIGASVVLVFELGDQRKPIILGVLRLAAGQSTGLRSANFEAEVDGQRLVVTANEQIVLRCGKASLTLTKAGKVLIEGTYVLSRATGVNRIKGGSVQLN